MNESSTLKKFVLTSLVMFAFAMNSLLCREALASNAIGVVEFTLARLISGAAVLGFLVSIQSGWRNISGNWLSSFSLFGYAACFSFAYVTLDAGTGALLLFGAVQISMISWGVLQGESLTALKWLGVGSAFAGLVWFVLPSVEAPPVTGAALMIVAGVCWGVYSLRGRYAQNATAETAGNFLRTVPLVAVLYIFASDNSGSATALGWALAIASGALASGLGYALWYFVLPGLTAATSATVQLSVPILASVGGVVLLGEAISIRLAVASTVVLGGIFVFINSGREKVIENQ